VAGAYLDLVTFGTITCTPPTGHTNCSTSSRDDSNTPEKGSRSRTLSCVMQRACGAPSTKSIWQGCPSITFSPYRSLSPAHSGRGRMIDSAMAPAVPKPCARFNRMPLSPKFIEHLPKCDTCVAAIAYLCRESELDLFLYRSRN
jgi:hypothetical protein